MANKWIASSLLLLWICSCCLTTTSASPQGKWPSKKLSIKVKRKPFVSLEKPAILQNYKRSKRQAITEALQEFQDFVSVTKEKCVVDMGMSKDVLEKTLLYETDPTPEEKCLMECVLKRVEIMNADNKLSPESISRIAGIVSNNNPLVKSIAKVSAEQCNRFVDSPQPCEAAFQINRCIANELKTRKIKLLY